MKNTRSVKVALGLGLIGASVVVGFVVLRREHPSSGGVRSSDATAERVSEPPTEGREARRLPPIAGSGSAVIDGGAGVSVNVDAGVAQVVQAEGRPGVDQFPTFHDEQIRQTWAGPAEVFVRRRFESAGPDGGLHLVSVECRSSMCLAVVELPAGDAGSSELRQYVSASFFPQCGHEIVEHPSEGGGVLRVDVLLHCRGSLVAGDAG